MMTSHKDEFLIWERFREGNEKAFAQLFDLFAQPLYHYGMKFYHDSDLIKDCIQDLFLKLYNNRTKLTTNDNPRLFLYKSLKNELIDKIRSRNRLPVSFVPEEDLHFSVEYYFDPEDEDEKNSVLLDQFERVMKMLTDRQKEAIYLKYQAEMSYEEIAQLLQINLQSARNLIHRAISKIRTEMPLPVFLCFLFKCI